MDLRQTVALCVTGSIAAYKAPMVARQLLARGLRVVPVLTRSACQFVGPSTFAGLCGESVHQDVWDAGYGGERHIDIARQADVIAIAPATADTLARLATGRADDLVGATVLAARSPVLVAPAMHPRMWANAAVRSNARVLSDRGILLVGPVDGPVASGDAGEGRMAEPEAIVAAILAALAPRDLGGVRVLVSAGPTFEDIDPVRFLGNRSSGRMGFAIAERAAARGAEVVLVAGPVDLPTPGGVRRINVRSARDLESAMSAAFSTSDLVIMAAAVADYRPRSPSLSKLKKSAAGLAVEWVQNPDILRGLADRKTPAMVLVGFALETGDDADVLRYAQEKLMRKGCDLLVANAASDALGTVRSRVHLVDRAGVKSLPVADKAELADAILTAALALRVPAGGAVA